MSSDNEGILGTGSTITFAETSFAAEITSMAQSGISRPAIKVSHFGSVNTNGVGSDAFVPGCLADQGSLDIGYNFRPGVATDRPSFTNGAELVTIEFASTHETGALVSFSGFFTDDGWDAPFEDNMTGSGTIKISGDVAYTAAAST